MPHERSHIVSSFEQELEQLRAMMVKIGRIVEEQVGLALRAISDHDESAAEEATRLDPEVEQLEVRGRDTKN